MTDARPLADITFVGEVIHWRGPAPFFFLVVPDEEAAAITAAARSVSYGWGMVPVEAEIREVPFTTALFPRDGTYYLPLKVALRRKAGVELGEMVAVRIVVPAKPGQG